MLNLKNHCQNSALNFRGNQNMGTQTVKDNLRQKILVQLKLISLPDFNAHAFMKILIYIIMKNMYLR